VDLMHFRAWRSDNLSKSNKNFNTGDKQESNYRISSTARANATLSKMHEKPQRANAQINSTMA